MRVPFIAALAVLAIGAAGCETQAGYGSGYGSGGTGGGFSRLSACQRNALLGAGAGAVLGGITAGKGAKTEGAVLGAAVGGLGTYGVCRYLDNQSVSRVEQGYQYSLNNNAPYSSNWQGANGQQSLYVNKPVPTSSNCRQLSSTLTVPNEGKQSLPPETYCKGSDGVWRPA